jgi:uroporphyrinogen decarboxylase
MLYSRPDLMHRILAINAEAVAGYLNAQIEAGAQAVMVFDSWGGALSHRAFLEFSLPYTAQVLSRLKRSHGGATIPRIVFTKGGGLWLPQMEKLECEVLGVDWTVNLAWARELVGGSKALQGNLDPAVLFAPPQQVAPKRARVLDDFGAPHTGAAPGRRTSSTSATASASTRRPTRAGAGGSGALPFARMRAATQRDPSVIRVFPS